MSSQPSTLDSQLSAPPDDLQAVCEAGSAALNRTEYLRAEALLVEAEGMAIARGDWDTLSRLYFPLQEARRQRRQRCGEGVVRLDLVQTSPEVPLDAVGIVNRYPAGQLLVAGWRSVSASLAVREEYRRRGGYGEVLLGAYFPLAGGGGVVAVLAEAVDVSGVVGASVEDIGRTLPVHTLLLGVGELPVGDRRGTAATFAEVMGLWERLHAPHLAMAASMPGGRAKLDAYRRVQAIDYACERAHQDAAKVAREIGRTTI